MSNISPEHLSLKLGKCPGTQNTFEIGATHASDELGYAKFFVCGSEMGMSILSVEPEYREQGIGSLLVEKVVDLAHELPKIKTLSTSAYNERTA